MKSSESCLIHKGGNGLQTELSETLPHSSDQLYLVPSVVLSSFREI